VGSLPHSDAKSACDLVTRELPEVPFWPQLPRRAFLEGAVPQFAGGLPCLRVDERLKSVVYDASNREKELETFYGDYLSGRTEAFKLDPDRAAGLSMMTGRMRQTRAIFMKGQVTGPVTFGLSVRGGEERALFYDDQMRDVIVKGLAMKACWQARLFADLGARPIIFMDEPSLVEFGSAFSGLNRDTVMAALTETIRTVQDAGALVGVHCCGNTDWTLLFDGPADIVSFDSAGYFDKMALYWREVRRFLDDGGVLAWGAVPTSGPAVMETAEGISEGLLRQMSLLAQRGIDRDLISSHSIITPSCGMGTMSVADAENTMRLLSRTGMLMREHERD
jgi:methionine synthase II (cobalamin-independent)